MKTIASFSKPEEAFLVRARLQGNGVNASIRDEHIVSAYWYYSNAIGGVRVEVEDDDVERAREILERPPCETGILICPQCGSGTVRIRELNVWTAVALTIGFPLPVKSRRADCLSCKRSLFLADCLMEEGDQRSLSRSIPPRAKPAKQ
ncbi:DUF2007 domain-containing protein [Synoicihabitans lomoniglobus]|uniref:DUF2007 domain-containing protein n=1 Tax=Synoicihabitans lomoniglobus TaxID=2909285 RepID=A0AAE9ZST9_9BACT|nr:DUF2007 domain-containing protein [Opitutaceae bacterium LMO-M01]